MSDKIVNVAMIGLGFGAEFLPIYQKHPNARIQSFSYFTSEPEDRFAPDLALLASLVGDGSLKPVLAEHSWRDIAKVGPALRDRHIAGKAVFRID